MKVGSIIENISNVGYEDFIKKETPYILREIMPIGSLVFSAKTLPILKLSEVGIRVEEVNANVIVGSIFWIDMPFPMKDFRELLPPMENIEAIINENVIVIEPELV